jgi:hypothetical protein
MSSDFCTRPANGGFMRALPLLLAAVLVVAALGAGPAPAPALESSEILAGVDAGSDSPAGDSAAQPSPAMSASTGDGAVPRQRGTVNQSQLNESALDAPIRVLDLPAGAAPNRTTVRSTTVDVGPALAFATNATENRLETLATLERVRSASTPAERQRRVLGAINEIEQEAVTIRSRQRAVIEQFARGERSARRLLVALARLDAQARALDDRRQRLARFVRGSEDLSLDSGRLATLGADLETFTGPVRSRVVAALRGDVPSTRVYAAAAPESVVLATVADDVYLRETYRGDLRSPGGGSVVLDEALNVTADAYPAVWATKSDVDGVGSGGTFVLDVPHPRGDLTAFVDSSSRRVFKEFQRRPLDTYSGGETVSSTKDGLQLTVNRTFPGGPLRVELVDAESGDPVDVTVTVGPPNGESVTIGRTGPDGVVWTLMPASRVAVTAVEDPRVVIVELSPTPVPAVRDGPPSDTDGDDGESEPPDGNVTETAGPPTSTPPRLRPVG